MKFIAIIFLLGIALPASSNNPYRAYLLSKISHKTSFSVLDSNNKLFVKANCEIPRFERPKGAVFCRMEDYLTAKTKVWIKIGVK